MRCGSFRLICVVFLCVCAVAPEAPGQSRPTLSLHFSAGQPTLTVTGTVGTVYSIQYATGVSATNHWTDRTLVQVQNASISWRDPDAPTPGPRFYRAISVPAPVDTNLVFIQPGTFTMGSPTNEALRNPDENQHSVTISRGFWMERYLVTQKDYLAVIGSNPGYFNTNNGYAQNLTRPVEDVSWYDATNYCAQRTQQERAAGRIPTNYVYRLPTESEWEYADRAGTTTALYLGCALHSGQANFVGTNEYDCAVGEVDNPSGTYLQMTAPVGSYAPNPWGLYDMTGNVEEWCQDWYGAYPTGPVTDPQGAATGSIRVVRGGDWANHGFLCRSAFRSGIGSSFKGSNFGFRAVLAPE